MNSARSSVEEHVPEDSLLLFSTDIGERQAWADNLEPRYHCEGASDLDGVRQLFSGHDVKIKLVLAELRHDRPAETNNVVKMIKMLKSMGWFYVPIVLIAHQDTEEDALAQCLDKGASGYIKKPFAFPTMLSDRVTSLLARFKKTQVRFLAVFCPNCSRASLTCFLLSDL